MGCGAFPETHPLSLRWLGMHGAAYANWAVNGEYEHRKNPADPMRKIAHGADLVLAFGVRFEDRVTGNVAKFCEGGTIVHIDIDPSEINKNKPANLPIISDIKYALRRLLEMIEERPISRQFTAWHQQIEAWKAKAPFGYILTEEVNEIAAHARPSQRPGERSGEGEVFVSTFRLSQNLESNPLARYLFAELMKLIS